MQKDNIITVYADGQRKTIYEITPIGKELIRVKLLALATHANAKALMLFMTKRVFRPFC